MPNAPALRISTRSTLEVREIPSPDRTPPGLRAAFARGLGHGLLHLGGPLLHATLEPTLGFGRELARAFYERLWRDPAAPELPPELGDRLRGALPPMPGAQHLSASTFAHAWAAMLSAAWDEIDDAGAGIDAWLAGQHPSWHALGRVYFHLAEHPRDGEFPFAFVATYVDGLTASGEPAHRTLGHALDVLADDQVALERLLAPLERAIEASPLIAAMAESGAVYYATRWTSADAYAFLQQIPACEAAGVRVRVPDWWRARTDRVIVQGRLGERESPALGVDALLDFDAGLALGGEPLSRAEVRELLAGAAGLRLVKGRWVTVDPERLREALSHFEQLAKRAKSGRLDFAKAMRLLAGVDTERGGDGGRPAGALDADELQPVREVVAGAWLAKILDQLGPGSARHTVEADRRLKATLRPYQSRGVAWLWLLWQLGLGGCLADDMGLGKTVQVLAVLLIGKRRKLDRATASPGFAGPHLIVVPASLLGNWEAEARKFAPSLRLRVAHHAHVGRAGAASSVAALEHELDGVDVVVTSYGTLTRTEWLRERDWGLVVLDEAQAIKNPDTKQSRACRRLRGRARVALTGTPVENRVEDLWSIFDFLNPGLLGSATEFRRWTARGFAPLRRLVSPYILRRLKSDPEVAPDLPDKTELVAYCQLSRKQTALYAETLRSLKRELDAVAGIERRGLILAYLVRFKQICDHPSLALGDGDWKPSDSGKFARLTELAESLAERQERALVFTQFRTMTQPISDHLAKVFGTPGLILDGRTPVRRRAELVERFQADDGPPYFVISLKAGGTGLNLTAASHVIHFDRWWNPAVENQATDRAHRIGQHQNVLVHKFVCRGTLEERIDAMISAKQALADEILHFDGSASLTELSNDELLSVIQLDLGSVGDGG
jgi:superfamily II DNA or RNA helicase